MKLLTKDLTANEIEFYKFAIEASIKYGHVTVDEIKFTDCQLSDNQIKGYVGALTKKGFIEPDGEYRSIFYVYAMFTDDEWTPTFYGEELEDNQRQAIKEFIG